MFSSVRTSRLYRCCADVYHAIRGISHLIKTYCFYVCVHCCQTLLSRKVGRKKIINVAVIVMGTDGFLFDRLVDLMLASGQFRIDIVVVPAYGYGTTNPDQTLLENVAQWKASRFGDMVISSRDGAGYLSLKGRYDLCLTTAVYEWQMHENFRLSTMAKQGVLPVAMPYGFDSGTIQTIHYVVDNPMISCVWRYYAVTENLQNLILRTHKVLRLFSAVRMSGMPKMDELAKVMKVKRERKVILLCPHHSVKDSMTNLNISNFLRFNELIIDLPKRYPQVDWIFRPHPLLRGVLISEKIWTSEQWDDFIKRLCDSPNMKYLPTGSMSELFVNSDAMIQDCGSFLTEYHCTGHPQCYVISSWEHLVKQFSSWGQQLLGYAYVALSEKDIMQFIDTVVLGGADMKADLRRRFVEEKLLVNHPRVSEWILNDIKKSLGVK